MWAAYRKGSFGPEFMREGLDQEGFDARLREILPLHSEWFVLEVDKPVGLIGMRTITRPNRPVLFEPHAEWFAWASPRNKLETLVRFLNDLRRDGVALIYANDAQAETMFDHLKGYGVLRRAGTLYDIFGWGAKTSMYQTRHPEA